jgi:outer membrane biosynthesis protein TonB
VSTPISQKIESINGQVAKVREIISGLEKQLGVLDGEIASHAKQSQQYKLLSNICLSLDQLNEMGASNLFWGSESSGYDPEKQLLRVRNVVAEFDQKISVIEQRRGAIQADIKQESVALYDLNDQLAELKEAADRVKSEYVLVRQVSDIPFQPMVMPWSKQGEDERRFRKLLLIIMLITIFLGGVVPLLKRPVDKTKEAVVPERIAQLVKKKQEPKPVEQKPLEKTDKKDEKAPSKTAPVETQKARAVAETKGVLAFKNNFADLLDDAPSNLGAQARISNSGKTAAGDAPQRSMIVAQATGGSGGINTSSLSRQGTGGGQNITGSGVKFARVESATGAGVADDRPLSKGAGPSRTDEEIQIVFDRYKSALYRIYNRELRNDPTLRGKMVLRLTIETDGRVSACTVKSTDLNSPALSADIIDRVLKFNFGPKQGVPTITILYPIDFLPAS